MPPNSRMNQWHTRNSRILFLAAVTTFGLALSPAVSFARAREFPSVGAPVPNSGQGSLQPLSPIPKDWLSIVTEDIRKSEYEFSRSTDGFLSAPNRAQN